MPRPARFSRQDLLDAAVRVCVQNGPGALTIAAVATASGAPVGSIYHRFASREHLLAETWVATLAAFQPGFIAALGRDSDPPGLDAALFSVNWARINPEAARLLVLYRRHDFVVTDLPDRLRNWAAQLASELGDAIARFASTAFGDEGLAAKQRATFLVLDLPNAAMRRYLGAGIAPPQEVDKLVAEAFTAMSTAATASD